MKNSKKELEIILDYNFKNPDLLRQSLIHKSFDNLSNNERLEFLGDAVLDLIVAEYLFQNLPEKDEGELTKIRSRLVDRISLSNVAESLNLDRFLLIEENFHNNLEDGKKTVRADALEALIGAIYLDTGLENTKKFVIKNIVKPSFNKGYHQIDKNQKGQLLELTHSKKIGTPVYKIIQEEGPEHNKLFVVSVFINNEEFGKGEGKNKKTAEQNAAKSALETIESNDKSL